MDASPLISNEHTRFHVMRHNATLPKARTGGLATRSACIHIQKSSNKSIYSVLAATPPRFEPERPQYPHSALCTSQEPIKPVELSAACSVRHALRRAVRAALCAYSHVTREQQFLYGLVSKKVSCVFSRQSAAKRFIKCSVFFQHKSTPNRHGALQLERAGSRGSLLRDCVSVGQSEEPTGRAIILAGSIYLPGGQRTIRVDRKQNNLSICLPPAVLSPHR